MADLDRIRIIVEPDTSGFQRELDTDLSRVTSEVTVDVDADTSDFDRTLAAARKQAEADGVDVNVGADTTEAAVKIKGFKKVAESEEIEVPVDIDHRGLVTGWRATLRRMERDTKKSSKGISADLSKSTVEFQRLAGLALPAALVSGIGALTGAVGALAAGAVAAVGPVVQLGAGMAALPGIVGPAIVAVKSIGFALEGVDDALGGLGETIDEDKLALLTPEAQRLVRTLDTLKAPVIDLQQALQTRLFPAFTDGIDRLKEFGPAVMDAADGVGVSIASMIDNATKLITNPFYSGIINRQIGTIDDTVSALGRSVTYLSLAFLRVVDAAQPFTEHVLQGIENVSRGLLDASTNTAGLRNFFLELRGTADTVFSLLGNVFGLMGNVFSAATPTGLELLDLLNKVTAEARAFTDTVAGRNQLHEYFQATKPTIIEIARLVRDLAGAILQFATDPSIPAFIAQLRTELLPAFVDLLTTANQNLPALTDAIVGLVRLFEQIAPAAGVAAEAIAQVAGPVADFLADNPNARALTTTVLGLATAFTLMAAPVKIVAGLLKPLVPAARALWSVFGGLTKILTRGLIGAVVRLLPFLGTIASAIGAVVAAIGLGPIIIGALVVALGVLIVKSQTFRDFLIFLGVQLLTFFTNIPKWVGQGIALIGQFLSTLGGLFARAFGAAVSAVQTAVTTYIKFVTFIPRRTIAALASLAALLVNFYRRIFTAAFNVVRTIIGNVIAFLAAVPGRVIAAMVSLGQLLWTFATNAFNRMRTAIVTVSQNIMSFVRGIPGRITSALGNLADLLYGKGKDVLQGFFDGLKSVWEKIKKWLGGIGDKIKSLKGPIEVDRTLLVDEGKAIMEGFHSGLESKWDSVAGWLSDRGGFIKGLLSPSGLKDVIGVIGDLFTGKVDFGEVSGTLDKAMLDGMHPSSGLEDTTRMANIIAKRFGMMITSLFRPGSITTTGNVSQHAVGMAADFSNGITTPQMDALAEWARKLIGKAFYQVLYRTMVGGNHFNHVHIGWLPARRHGGRVHSGHAYMTGESGPEPFVADDTGFIMSNAKFRRMMATNDRLRNVEAMVAYQRQAGAPVSTGVTQDIDFNIELKHNVPDAGSLLSILSTRLDAFARASMPNLAGGTA